MSDEIHWVLDFWISSSINVNIIGFFRKWVWKKGIHVTCHLIVLMYNGMSIVESLICYDYLSSWKWFSQHVHGKQYNESVFERWTTWRQEFFMCRFSTASMKSDCLHSLSGSCWLLTSLVKQLSCTKRRCRREFSQGFLWWNTAYTRGLAELPLWAPRTEILCSAVSLHQPSSTP